jgi:hypothetical protein
VLPASSLCLIVPIVPPSMWDRPHAREQQEEAARHLKGFVTEAAVPETSP